MRASSRAVPLPLVGWLFADLMLLLAIVGFGQAPTMPHKPSPSATAVAATGTPKATAPTKTTPKVTQRPIGVSQNAIVVAFPVPTAKLLAHDTKAVHDLDARLRKEMARIKGQRAGIVLTFGVDPDDARALALSHVVNERLRRQAPALTQGALVRDFVSLSGSNAIKIEVYLFTK
ncbi:hypothetical protein [Pedococcus sp. 5OH_020]|uniref:hypothetical protein n=1 Tax=Pedococcus sp. 5OH_020 TaxID=2989814 RepID=UPI0022E9F69D|nr:hypothetical protein [Pedococcus sp. 5OH_020]